MTIQDIAEQAFGAEYGIYSHKALDERVRRSISRACGEITMSGLVVSTLQNLKLKGNPVDRWKVAVSEQDAKDVLDTIERKRVRANGFVDATQRQIDNATEKGLLQKTEAVKRIK